MKKIFVVLLAIFIIGCGNKSEKKFEGVAAQKKDYVAEGVQYLQKSDINHAIQNFDQAIKQDPKNVANYVVLGQVYMNLKQYNRAVDTFAAAVMVNPNNADAHYLLATSMALDGRKEEAVKAAQRSVELFLQQKNEPRFKQAVALLKSLTNEENDSSAPAKK